MEVLAGPLTPAQARRSPSLRLAIAFVIVAGVVLAIPFVPYIEAVGLTAIIVVTFSTYLLARRKGWDWDHFEIFIPVSAVYFVYFGGAGIYSLVYPESLPTLTLRPYLVPALALCVVGYLAFVVGYATLFTNTTPSRTLGLRPTGLVGVLVPAILGWIGQMADVYHGQFRLARHGAFSASLSAVQVFSPLFFYGWFQGCYLFWSRWSTLIRRLVLMLLLVPLTASVLFTKVGAKGPAMLMMATPAVAFWYTRRIFPWKAFVAILLAFLFVVFPVYNTFREQSRKLGTLERLEKTALVARTWDSEAYMDRSVKGFMRRMAIITSVAAVLRDVPRLVDFKYGETLFLAPISILVPRFLWPGKPNISLGDEFGRTFHFVVLYGGETYIAPSIVGELYWNYHIPGVVIGMLLFGACLRWSYQKYGVGYADDPIRKSIYFMLLLLALGFEGNIALLVGAWVKTLAVATVLILVLRRAGLIVPASRGVA